MSDDPISQVTATARALVEAFSSHNAQAYFDFFAHDATFVFYTHPEILTSRKAWETLWAQWENEVGFHVHSCESQDLHVQMVSADVAVMRHRVVSAIEMDGVVDTVTERETIVFCRYGSTWKAVHEHLSPVVSLP